MIITQTPYRVSFAGGGTDLPAFYRHEPGAVLSVGVNHHMYVTVSPRFERTTRVAYKRVEITEAIDEIEHTIAREALRLTGLGPHLEITTVGDVPAGTGMGSSSSLAVGLLNALYAYRGQVASPHRLAREACDIEIDILQKPIGRQDQYAAAHGGVNYIRFNPDHSVDVEPVPADPEFLHELERHILLLYTDRQRDADVILQKQSEGSADKMTVLRQMRDLAGEMRQTMGGGGDLAEFGRLLHEGWELKRSLGFGISNQGVDEWYRAARAAGAMGGKLLGAGGGGFLLVMAPPETHEAIRAAVGRPRELPFSIDRRGSRVIFISDRYAF
ncbi:D-glycero-alpha-D-manno-heptose-7-phosphate kinase [Rhodovulum sp. ES.010]|uniref:GHMP family kinase ATP-binding protein n=1 Tax=Rhodovulum sp. ES.010 TaxID=1882821 RepID=UPI000929E87F|nr:GHMP kinase [Rhodovulum sp. ES.010]SIO59898.1 D-glycero-alpha-D-manno-heptose-7-phosphate kinase [Rhodovulum sp. ES.010]